MSYLFKYRAHAEALYAALTEDAFYITMEHSAAGGSAPKEAMLRYLDYSMQEAWTYGVLIAPADAYGASAWSRPLDPATGVRREDEKKRFLLDNMGEQSLRTYSDIVASMSRGIDTLIDKRSWYLSILGVAPGFQGSGLGVGLIKGVLETTDALGVATYLETFTPRNMTFYERLGYRTAGAIDEPITGARYWVMIRTAGRTR